MMTLNENALAVSMIILGCPSQVAYNISYGTTFCESIYTNSYVYIAGGMRGYENHNFPAFDSARDKLIENGYNVISPADIDRHADDYTKEDEHDQSKYVLRDFWSIYFLNKVNPEKRNKVHFLDGWERSVGANAEFFLGRWLGLQFTHDIKGEYSNKLAIQDFIKYQLSIMENSNNE